MTKKSEEGYPLVAVVVPVHNNKKYTEQYLLSLRRANYPKLKVIVIDDGSTDGTEEMIRKQYPEVILIKGDGTLWWSRATNLGIKKAIEIGADYVFLGDNDSTVHPDSIFILVETADKNPRSIITSKVYNYDNPKILQQAGSELKWFRLKRGGANFIGVDEIDRGQYDKERDIPFATVGVLVKTAFFYDFGFMDYRTFPQYLADIDFSLRAFKKGYRIIYQPKSIVWHKGGATTLKEIPTTRSVLKTFIDRATNIKSHNNLYFLIRFYLRHCPWYLLPYILPRYVLLRFLYLIKLTISERIFYNRNAK